MWLRKILSADKKDDLSLSQQNYLSERDDDGALLLP